MTDQGDADLYASTSTKTPDHADYQFSSTSCGLDIVVMPTTMGVESHRVYVSVVGHCRHEVSHYRLVIVSPHHDDISKYQVLYIQLWILD